MRAFRSRVTRRQKVSEKDEDGQALVEFALTLLPLTLILLGILQFGLLFYNYIDLTSAVREGARTASVSRSQTDGVDRARNAISNATSVVDDTRTTVDVTAQPWNAGQDVTVRVSYPYELNILGLVVWHGPMVSESVVRVE